MNCYCSQPICKKDILCAGLRGTIRLPSSNPDCENDVQIFYLCKSMTKTRNQVPSRECFWMKTLGGLIDNVFYGKWDRMDTYLLYPIID